MLLKAANILFWMGMVIVALMGLKLTIGLDVTFHPIGILCLTAVCYFIDTTSKPSSTYLVLSTKEEAKDETKHND